MPGVAIDSRGRQHGVPNAPVAPGENCWLHVTGLDRYIEEEEVQAALLEAATPWGVVKCDVAGFADEGPPYRERRPRDQGRCTHGWALLRFPDELLALEATGGLRGLRLGPHGPLVVSPARCRVQLSAQKQAQRTAAAAAEAQRREEQRQHNSRQRQRRREKGTAVLEEALERLAALGGGVHACSQFVALDDVASGCHWAGLDWDSVPEPCRPDAVLSDIRQEAGLPGPMASPEAQSQRLRRKRVQVESFACALSLLLDGYSSASSAIRVVDFGCGTGGLALPLAALFPRCDFTAVDLDATSIGILQKRAAAAGLGNITGCVSRIEVFDTAFDVALGLHCCGAATDYAQLKAISHGAAYILCPCCVGKVVLPLSQKQGRSGLAVALEVTRPRSAWMQSACDGAAFAALAAAADVSHSEESGGGQHTQRHLQVSRLCALNVALDRSKAGAEAGYEAACMTLFEPGIQAKNMLLVGVPKQQHWAQAVARLSALERHQ
jgi:SAM-dependent methyltransferase